MIEVEHPVTLCIVSQTYCDTPFLGAGSCESTDCTSPSTTEPKPQIPSNQRPQKILDAIEA